MSSASPRPEEGLELGLVPPATSTASPANVRQATGAQEQRQEGAALIQHTNGNGTAPAPSSSPSPAGASLSTEYLEYLHALRASWTDCPSLSIAFTDLSYEIRNAATIADAKQVAAREKRGKAVGVPSKREENIPNLAKTVASMALSPLRLGQATYRAASGVKPDQAEVLQALAPASGVIKPATMTLVLAPPGAGKSTLLRALAGRLNGDSGLKGQVYFNGLTVEEAKARGVHVTRLASFVGQQDASFPVLTVEETLEFAKQNGVADVELLNPDAKLRAMDARRSELLMEMLGLTECRTTVIGSDLLRGVSGGQRKRTQLGEALMSNSRLLALDEVSNGLDSAVTLHIFSVLKEACAVNNSSVVTALQQVTPETYAHFDQVILMREGHILYHGPRDGIRGWLRDVMKVPFIPESIEEAGFLVDLLSDPKSAFEKAALAHKVYLQQQAANGEKPAASIAAPTAAPASRTSEWVAPSPAGTSSGDPMVVRFHIDDDSASGAAGPGAPLQSAADYPEGTTPFKLSAADLHSLSDLDDLLAANARSVYSAATRAVVEEALIDGSTLAAKSMDVSTWSAYSKSQYGREFPHSTLKHTALCCERQVKLLSRALTMVIPRIFSAILMGIIYGTLFYKLQQDDFASKLGIIQNAVMFMAFANFEELPVASESKQVVVRQINAGFYPSFSYTLSVNLLTMPLALVETIIFGLLVYFIPDFDMDAGRFFFFLLLLFSISSAMSQTFRLITYLSSNADVANQLNLPFIMLFVVYGGFLIPRDQIQNWLIWAYYLSAFSWGTDSLAINEFSASKYSSIDATTGERLGDTYLKAFGLRPGLDWQWYAIVYLWGYYVVLSLFSAILLAWLTPTQPMGTKRTARATRNVKKELESGNEQQQLRIEISKDAFAPNGNGLASTSNGSNGHAASNGHNAGALSVDAASVAPQKRLGGGAKSSAKASFQLSSLPFTPATLAWKDLKYTVYIGKQKTPRVLLNHISGYAEPGQLTALMGASGAGKTTLMDVIAGRKTVGLIEHDSNIFVNGRPKDETFSSITGYVEQTDIHNGMATVREALEFSAKLRLPASVSDETRKHFIEEVMQLVGLTNFQNRMVGDVSQPSLSTGQLKLLTIAVELVANPSILFLDEPTSGLDSKSAYRVMRAIKRIAATNRTVVCTIHQPSQEVFFMFDRLLLLRRGGETVYFDEIGEQGNKLVSYMTRVSRNLIPWSPLVSPANWMLDVVGLDATQLIEEQQEAARLEAEEAAKKQKASDPKGVMPVVTVAAEEQKTSEDAAAVVDPSIQKAFKRKLLAAAKSSARSAGASSFREGGPNEDDEVRPIEFSREWRASAESITVQKTVDRYSTPGDFPEVAAHERPQYVGELTRLVWVVRRAYLSHWRAPPVNITRCILMFVIGLFLGIVYYNISVYDYSGMSSLIAAVFLGVSLPSAICSNASLSTFIRQRAVYYREHSVNMYGYKLYTATMTLVELPYLFVGLMCFLIPFYFMVGLSLNAGLFFQFVLASYLMVLFFSFVEQVFIASLPNIVAAQALNGLVMNIMFAFGGLWIKAASIPMGWKWFYYIDPIPKAFIATMLTQVYCPAGVGSEGDSGGRIDGCRNIFVPGEGDVQLYVFLSKMLEGNHSQYWTWIGWLVLILAVIRLFSLYLFKTVSHIQR